MTHKLRYAHSISLAGSYGHGHLAVTKHLRETREERIISSCRFQNSSLRLVIMATGTGASVFKQSVCRGILAPWQSRERNVQTTGEYEWATSATQSGPITPNFQSPQSGSISSRYTAQSPSLSKTWLNSNCNHLQTQRHWGWGLQGTDF